MKTVAFFDSGIGGLSVLEEASQKIDARFIFYADRDNVPYGEKPKEDILKYVDEAVEFLFKSGADAVVLACNTATSVAAKTLRQKYDFPIIGMEPAAKRALDIDGTKRVLVTATPVTVAGEKMKELIGRV
ncbi:MAG: aspartate/glutamate racemase family protein, partial [Selenomonadaceae bacterium]|nr:aspartate/glutamate racemase family protein [Selenomonadaceae bacterium]